MNRRVNLSHRLCVVTFLCVVSFIHGTCYTLLHSRGNSVKQNIKTIIKLSLTVQNSFAVFCNTITRSVII